LIASMRSRSGRIGAAPAVSIACSFTQADQKSPIFCGPLPRSAFASFADDSRIAFSASRLRSATSSKRPKRAYVVGKGCALRHPPVAY
jgi:hypothetical protein